MSMTQATIGTAKPNYFTFRIYGLVGLSNEKTMELLQVCHRVFHMPAEIYRQNIVLYLEIPFGQTTGQFVDFLEQFMTQAHLTISPGLAFAIEANYSYL